MFEIEIVEVVDLICLATEKSPLYLSLRAGAGA